MQGSYGEDGKGKEGKRRKGREGKEREAKASEAKRSEGKRPAKLDSQVKRQKYNERYDISVVVESVKTV